MPGHWECDNGHAIHDKRPPKVCPECGADLRWKASQQKEALTPAAPARSGPADRSTWAWITLGFIIANVGGFIFLSSEEGGAGEVLGLLVLAVGSIVLQIGVLAEGVRFGIEVARR